MCITRTTLKIFCFKARLYYKFKIVMDGICFSVTGGATYCAVASLRLMGFIEDDLVFKSASSCIINVPLLLEWALQVWISIFLI